VVGAFGLLQTVADALKYVVKEVVIPPAPTGRCSCWRR
jgi:NADH:ubiquinone oxidoreductase subunit H